MERKTRLRNLVSLEKTRDDSWMGSVAKINREPINTLSGLYGV